jgi:hypothetical protein
VWLLKEPKFRRNMVPLIISVTRNGELGTSLAVTSNRRKTRINTVCHSTSVQRASVASYR